MTAALSSLLLLLSLSAAEAKERYPHAEILMEAEELAKPEVAAKLRILDVRPKQQYEAGHIAGAASVNLADWPGTVKPEQLSALGIESTTPVVVYDGGTVRDATRAWWILAHAGHKDVRLLNGGWPAWKAAGGKASTETPRFEPVGTATSQGTNRLADKQFVLNAIKDKSYQIIDTRSEGEYCGQEAHAKRGGAIPGAVHLEWSDTLDSKTKKFKSPTELRKLFKDAGIDPTKPAITYCQSGGRASVMAFVLELMGDKDVRNYYKSWAEWGNDPGTPIETPKPKK